MSVPVCYGYVKQIFTRIFLCPAFKSFFILIIFIYALNVTMIGLRLWSVGYIFTCFVVVFLYVRIDPRASRIIIIVILLLPLIIIN